MRLKRSFSFILVLALIFTLVLSGCSTQDASTKMTKEDKNTKETTEETAQGSEDKKNLEYNGDPVTIKYATWAPEERSKKVIKLFEKSHPNINVEKVKSITWPWNEKMAAAAAAGKMPDVFFTFGVPIAVANGWAADLKPYLEADEQYDSDVVFGNFIETANYDGHQYAMPFAMHAMIIYYNKDLFAKANVPIPDADWTVNDMRQKAIKLTNFSEHQFGFQNPRGMRMVMVPQFNPTLEWGTWDGEEYNIDDPAFTKAINFLETMVTEDKVTYMTYPKKKQEKWFGKDKNPWTLGKIAMKYGGTWGLTGNTENNKFDWGVVPVPKAKGQRIPLVGDYMSISKSSKHKAAAFEFLKWMSYSKKGWKVRTKAGIHISGIPLIKDSEVWKRYLSRDDVPPEMKEILKRISNGTVDPFKWLPGYQEAHKIIYEYFKKFEKGTARPSGVADELQKKAQATYEKAYKEMKQAMKE